jgi:hypothetical protein
MAEPVRARRLSDQEGQTLQRIVRRGTHDSIRVRRALIIMASASGTTVAAIAAGQRAQGHGSGGDPRLQPAGACRPGPSVGGWPSPPDQP